MIIHREIDNLFATYVYYDWHQKSIEIFAMKSNITFAIQACTGVLVFLGNSGERIVLKHIVKYRLFHKTTHTRFGWKANN